MSPATCERDPTDSATAVRAALALVVMPPEQPADRLAAPRPIRSRFASTSYPLRAANARELTSVSAAATSAIAAAAGNSCARSWSDMSGIASGGSPEGSAPSTATPCACRFSAATKIVAPTTPINAPGTGASSGG